MYIRVYSPDGEPFDVTRHRADELILQQGWTQSCPVEEERTEATRNPFLDGIIVETSLIEASDDDDDDKKKAAATRTYKRKNRKKTE